MNGFKFTVATCEANKHTGNEPFEVRLNDIIMASLSARLPEDTCSTNEYSLAINHTRNSMAIVITPNEFWTAGELIDIAAQQRGGWDFVIKHGFTFDVREPLSITDVWKARI